MNVMISKASQEYIIEGNRITKMSQYIFKANSLGYQISQNVDIDDNLSVGCEAKTETIKEKLSQKGFSEKLNEKVSGLKNN